MPQTRRVVSRLTRQNAPRVESGFHGNSAWACRVSRKSKCDYSKVSIISVKEQCFHTAIISRIQNHWFIIYFIFKKLLFVHGVSSAQWTQATTCPRTKPVNSFSLPGVLTWGRRKERNERKPSPPLLQKTEVGVSFIKAHWRSFISQYFQWSHSCLNDFCRIIASRKYDEPVNLIQSSQRHHKNRIQTASKNHSLWLEEQ